MGVNTGAAAGDEPTWTGPVTTPATKPPLTWPMFRVTAGTGGLLPFVESSAIASAFCGVRMGERQPKTNAVEPAAWTEADAVRTTHELRAKDERSTPKGTVRFLPIDVLATIVEQMGISSEHTS